MLRGLLNHTFTREPTCMREKVCRSMFRKTKKSECPRLGAVYVQMGFPDTSNHHFLYRRSGTNFQATPMIEIGD
jgi:hypothetical protein